MLNYYLCGRILQEVDQKKIGFKQVIFRYLKQNKFQQSQVKQLYSIIIKTLSLLGEIKKLASNIIQQKEKGIKSVYVFAIYVVELMQNKLQRGNKFGGGQMKTVIFRHENFIKEEMSKYFQQSQSNEQSQIEGKSNAYNFQIKNKIYLRILKESIDFSQFKAQCIQLFQSKRLKNVNEEQQFVNSAISLDKHIPELIIMDYSFYKQMKNSPQLDEQKLITQGKASCLPAYFLFKPILKIVKQQTQKNKQVLNRLSFDVIDSCAAPGNKTIQLGDYLNRVCPSGHDKVFAFEKNQHRYQLLASRIKQFGMNNIEAKLQDYLKADLKNDPMYKNVKFALVDPSCSGSGMKNSIFGSETFKQDLSYFRHSEASSSQSLSEQQKFASFCKSKYEALNKNERREISKYQKLQTSILNHTMTLPNIQKIVYSTCSFFIQENEQVVQQILEKNQNFEIINACEKWGDSSQDDGLLRGLNLQGEQTQLFNSDYLIRTNPYLSDLDGFFVAMFRRKIKHNSENNQ